MGLNPGYLLKSFLIYIYIFFFSQNGHGYLDENIDVLEEGEKKEDDEQQRSHIAQ